MGFCDAPAISSPLQLTQTTQRLWISLGIKGVKPPARRAEGPPEPCPHVPRANGGRGQKPCVHLLILVRHWLQAESDGLLETTKAFKIKPLPGDGAKYPPLASSRSGKARSPSQASYSRLNFKRGTAKINSTGASLKLDHTARSQPAALKSMTLNPGHFSRS